MLGPYLVLAKILVSLLRPFHRPVGRVLDPVGSRVSDFETLK